MRVHSLPAMLVFGVTDVGTVRGSNEDNFLIDEGLGLAMVADGMGGHDAGEVASAAVLTELRAYLEQHAPGLSVPSAQVCVNPDPDATWCDPADSAIRLIHAAVSHANARLYAQNCARNRPDGGGMGATLTGFWRASATAPLITFHIGDSRLYRLREGVLEQLTRDQTLYQQAVETGMLERLPARNLLLQAVGPSPAVTAEVRSHMILAGDILMLCSDGLHGSVPHADMERTLADTSEATLAQVCARLVDMAKTCGGRDNVTVLVACCG
jgi:protein phosphatase